MDGIPNTARSPGCDAIAELSRSMSTSLHILETEFMAMQPKCGAQTPVRPECIMLKRRLHRLRAICPENNASQETLGSSRNSCTAAILYQDFQRLSEGRFLMLFLLMFVSEVQQHGTLW